MFEYIFTIGCFDKFHKGHIKLLENMKIRGEKIIVGLHDNSSINKLKNVTDIDLYESRKKNLEKYADDIFIINDVDPTKAIHEYISKLYYKDINEINNTVIYENYIINKLDYDSFSLYGTNLSYLDLKHNSDLIKLPIGLRSKHFYNDNEYCIYNERDYDGELFKGNGNGRLIIKNNKFQYHSKIFDLHNNNCSCGGSEDYRYIRFNNTLYVVMNALPKNSKIRQMYLYNIKKDKICQLFVKNNNVSNIYQKNWTPYVYKNNLYFIYSFCDLCVVKLNNDKTGECELVHGDISKFTNKGIFGGTNLCHWKNNLFIGFAHIRNPWYSVPIIFDAEKYNYISTLSPIKIDLSFGIDILKHKTVQYPYYVHKNSDENIYEISICHQDFYSIKYKISFKKIDSLFNDLLNFQYLLSTNIGSSTNNSKVVSSYYSGDLFFVHNYKDTFEYYYKNKNLIISRTDTNGGWGQKLIGYKKNICFMRGDDNIMFPSFDYIKYIMPIQYLPYSKDVSATLLRNFKINKVGLMNYLLQQVVDILDIYNIPYYLDCGTLLGCIRENALMEKDTDVDVTIHLSYWEKLDSIDFSKYDLIRTRTLRGFPNKIDGNMISVKTKYSNLYCDIYTNRAFPLLDNKVLNGKQYCIPLNSELYLSQLYGNWKIPSNTHASTEFHRGDGLVNSEYNKYWDNNFEIIKC